MYTKNVTLNFPHYIKSFILFAKHAVIIGGFMKSVQIKLKFAEQVKSFVQKVAVFPGELDLRSGRYVVDAKSILGIFSLDLSKPITLEIYDNDCEELLKSLEEFIIK